MNPLRCAVLIIVAVALPAVPALGSSNDQSAGFIKQGDELFRSGEFDKAQKAYEQALPDDSAGGAATLRLGEIALLGNRLADAKRHLERAIELRPDDKRRKSLLAEVYYRQDDFAKAAQLERDRGAGVMADQLESFTGTTPYEILGDAEMTSVKFVQTDPLPLVKARINGGEEVHLLIDTGAAELVLDPDFADSIGAVRFGSTEGMFAGGRKMNVHHAKIDSIQLGDFTIKNVPVTLMNTRRMPFARGGQRIEGIIGTVLFYHFITTLDYPNGRLVLSRITSEALSKLDEQAKSPQTHVTPFWLSGRHWIVAWGRANDSEPFLMHVDTGMAGGGFDCPESTIKNAGITLSNESFEGMGGGGPVRVTPFTVEKLALGEAVQSNVRGLFGGFSPEIEYAKGFRLGGTISHGFFRPYALTFDFTGMRMLLTPGR